MKGGILRLWRAATAAAGRPRRLRYLPAVAGEEEASPRTCERACIIADPARRAAAGVHYPTLLPPRLYVTDIR